MPSDAPRVENRSGHDEPLPTHPDSARMLAELPSASAADGASLEGTMVQQERTDSSRNANALPVIPGYHVISELARGGMGIVFNAHDLSLDREVAIKTLLPELATRRDLAAQFDREARITARLQHPGVPPIHALGTLADGRPFLVMKLIRGRTLQDEVDVVERPGGLPRLLGVFEQLCQTVGYAHSLGIIHRDLKPLNVMVGAFGEVQVMDWGLAKEVQGRTLSTFSDEDSHPPVARDDVGKSGAQAGTTRVGRAKGTSSYMPPEQARGVWDHVDTRADVFALGGILCTILTGKPPYVGATGQAILSMAMEGDLQEAFERLDACGADAELISLSKRCMSMEFTDRPGTGKVVAEAVAAYRAGVELRARKAETEWAVSEARAEEAAHGHALAYCTLGNALQDKGDLVAAIEAYHEAIQLNPSFAPAFSNLGVALHDSGDLPGAIAAYRESIRLDPTDPKAHSNLGIALREAGDVPGAITAFKEVIERDPQSAEAHFDLGNVMQLVGNIDAAISSFEEAAFLAPETAVLHAHLAVVNLLRKRNEEAIAAAKEAIWRNPLDPCADLAHGIILFAQGDTTAGRLAFEEAVRQEPERWEVSFRQLFPSAPSPVGPLD